MVMWIMSDRTIPRSFRFMEGFGVHTFRLVNDAGKSTFVKFHWKPKLGLQSVVWNEAVKINGADPDFHRRDLWDAITAGDAPEWELGVQLFDDDFADSFDFDVLDATKLIPEELVPVRRIGRMVLDQVVDNFFAETEQVAFCTQNVVRGIDFTNDPLLQGRNFSYLDTQLKRLGSPNFTNIPVNAPRCPVAHFQQDGHMAMVNPVGRANYEPNSWNDQPGADGGPREDPIAGTDHTSRSSMATRGASGPNRSPITSARRASSTPARQSSNSSTSATPSCSNSPRSRRQASASVVVAQLVNIDTDLATAVANGLGLARIPEAIAPAAPPIDQPQSDALSIMKNGPAKFTGRRVGALVSQGVDAKVLAALRASVEAEGAQLMLVAPTISGVTDSGRAPLVIDEAVAGGPSVLFDAIAVILTADGAAAMAQNPAAKDFVTDAHAHSKFIAYTATSMPLFAAAGLSEDMIDGGYVAIDRTKKSAEAFVRACRSLRYWDRANPA